MKQTWNKEIKVKVKIQIRMSVYCSGICFVSILPSALIFESILWSNVFVKVSRLIFWSSLSLREAVLAHTFLIVVFVDSHQRRVREWLHTDLYLSLCVNLRLKFLWGHFWLEGHIPVAFRDQVLHVLAEQKHLVPLFLSFGCSRQASVVKGFRCVRRVLASEQVDEVFIALFRLPPGVLGSVDSSLS
jgi:hypothetical protein